MLLPSLLHGRGYAGVRAQSDEDPYGEGEPVFNAGSDTLILADGFDTYATVDARHTQLLALRSAQGATTHQPFISDNRMVDWPDPEGVHYQLHQIASPGRGGSGRALRSTYLGNTAGNQGSTWRTWPSSMQYSPITARIPGVMYFRITSEGWEPEYPGLKFFELWYQGSAGRIQASVGTFGQAFSWWRVNISNTEVGTYVTGRRRFSQVNADPTRWWRMTWDYKASLTANDGTGYFKGWIGGVPAWDISAAAVARGEITQAELNRIEPLGIQHVQWPDILNTNVQAQAGVFEFDDFAWWKAGA